MNTLNKRLSMCGLIPFFTFALLTYLEIDLININSLYAFIAYSAIILSFLSGTLWGVSLKSDNLNNNKVILFSNLMSLLAWASLLIESLLTAKLALALLTVGFILTLRYENNKQKMLHKAIALEYMKLRTLLTANVVALHVLLLIFL